MYPAPIVSQNAYALFDEMSLFAIHSSLQKNFEPQPNSHRLAPQRARNVGLLSATTRHNDEMTISPSFDRDDVRQWQVGAATLDFDHPRSIMKMPPSSPEAPRASFPSGAAGCNYVDFGSNQVCARSYAGACHVSPPPLISQRQDELLISLRPAIAVTYRLRCATTFATRQRPCRLPASLSHLQRSADSARATQSATARAQGQLSRRR